ncbi:glycosyltransferase [Pedobacter nototheniae]|uniref:glycosyltransferase n=1 Tax=Pedobacter nototheniae TaxID=2488994 RepID=UPI00103C2CAB|nr:glycosyltransferase [Pedobacter nototheniae]
MIYKKGITAHTLVKNEEKWVWFAIMSVIDFVDHMIIYDTGSTDKTCAVIDEILKDERLRERIDFQRKGAVSKEQFTKLRQEQIEKTKTKWFLVLDGDEIWYKKDFINLIKVAEFTTASMLAIKFHNCTKDVYHYTKYESGGYNIKSEKGNVTLKLISMDILGVHADGPYGMEGYFDIQNRPIQESESDIEIVDGFFLHTSNLIRSKNIFHDWKIPYRRAKIFSEVEESINNDFLFPEVFYLKRPKIVPNPFKRAGISYYFFKSLTIPINILISIKRALK